MNRWFSVAADKEELLASIKDVVEENLGMAMVFTIYSAVKDNAEQLIMDRQAAEQKGQEAKVLAAEAKENEKFHGTPVTPETFTTWRDEFMAELEAQRLKEEEELEASEKKKNRGKEVVVQMTGRQLWERGLAGKIEDDDDDGTLPADIRIDKLSVEA